MSKVLDGEIYSPDEMTPAEMYDNPLAAHVYMSNRERDKWMEWANVAQDHIINDVLKASSIGMTNANQGPFVTPRSFSDIKPWRNRAERRRTLKLNYINRSN